jgi:hypothetical protein
VNFGANFLVIPPTPSEKDGSYAGVFLSPENMAGGLRLREFVERIVSGSGERLQNYLVIFTVV